MRIPHIYGGLIPGSRGEHAPGDSHPGGRRGSSPLTRGARFISSVMGLSLGLIPAHAGSTEGLRVLNSRIRAHPRSRGEHEPENPNSWGGLGSSPLTRGALVWGGEDVARMGLIPAHAGSTVNKADNSALLPAHPRSRGEHSYTTADMSLYSGSSPLTRGARTL